MRYTRFLSMGLCLSAAGLYAQTASLQAPHTTGNTRSTGAMSFNYDAQHDSISASGLQVKPSIKSNSPVTPTTGTIMVTINMTLASHFAKGTSVHCSLMAIGGILDLNNGTIDGAVETVNGHASSSGPGSATCTLTIPYSWTLPPDSSADSGLLLIFGASALEGLGEDAVVKRSTLQLDGIENLPASGATSKYTFDVTL